MTEGPKILVLTEIVADERGPRPAVDAVALEALSRELERAVLSRLGPELERVIAQIVREAVAASVARALALTETK